MSRPFGKVEMAKEKRAIWRTEVHSFVAIHDSALPHQTNME